MIDNQDMVEQHTAHKHLFTPRDWCMIPYCAQYGLTKDKVKSEPLLESIIMDQYARDCGFSPGESWVLIVKPSGECEFTPLGPNDPHWCCEKEDEIASKITRATVSAPPYVQSNIGLQRAGV